MQGLADELLGFARERGQALARGGAQGGQQPLEGCEAAAYPVVQDGRLVGSLPRRNIMSFIAGKAECDAAAAG